MLYTVICIGQENSLSLDHFCVYVKNICITSISFVKKLNNNEGVIFEIKSITRSLALIYI